MRGLNDKDPQKQTFEIYLPLRVRQQYDSTYKSKLNLKDLEKQNRRKKVKEENKGQDALSKEER